MYLQKTNVDRSSISSVDKEAGSRSRKLAPAQREWQYKKKQ